MNRTSKIRFHHLIGIVLVNVLLVTFPVISSAQPLYQVSKVKSWDTLNLRSSAGMKSDIVGRIPAVGRSISLLGEQVAVGKTIWVKINWQGKQGWVSQHFLQRMQPEVKQATKPSEKRVDKGVTPNQWILRCGNIDPFWRVDVYPKALKLFTGKYTALLPITYKKQEKNKWNTAKTTHLKGASSNDNVDLVISYTYKRCNDSLSKAKVPYDAVIERNGKEMQGCCRAMKIN
jgi:uncharacterized membrane protein